MEETNALVDGPCVFDEDEADPAFCCDICGVPLPGGDSILCGPCDAAILDEWGEDDAKEEDRG